MASVKIRINNKSNSSLFRHMNKVIVDSYKRKGIIPSMGQHKATFEETYKVKLELGESHNFWKYMEFPSEQDYLMAVLKWQ